MSRPIRCVAAQAIAQGCSAVEVYPVRRSDSGMMKLVCTSGGLRHEVRVWGAGSGLVFAGTGRDIEVGRYIADLKGCHVSSRMGSELGILNNHRSTYK